MPEQTHPWLLRRPAPLALLLALATLPAWAPPLLRHPPPVPLAALANEPMAVTGWLESGWEASGRGAAAVLRVETVRALNKDAPLLSVATRLRIESAGPPPAGLPGDRLRVIGRFEPPAAPRIPGVFDFGRYLRAQGLAGVLRSGPRSIENTGDGGRAPLRRRAARMRDRALDRMARHLNNDQAAVMGGLTLGRRPTRGSELRQAFLDSGTMHILVASGANIAIVVGAGALALRLIGAAGPGATPLLLFAVWAYAFAAGLDAPVQRAAWMATVALTGRAIGREDRPLHALSLAALALLIARPLVVFDAGFQMSFLAVFGLVQGWPRGDGAAPPPWPRVLTHVAFGATVLAQLWLMPVAAGVFGAFAPAGVAANAIMMPVSGIGLPVGFAALAFDWAPLWRAAGLYADLLAGLARFFARWPTVRLSPWPPAIVAAYYALLVLAPAARTWRGRGIWAAGALIWVGVLAGHTHHARRVERLEVRWLDTGRATVRIASLPGGRVVVLDTGALKTAPGVERVLVPHLLHAHRAPVTDVVLLTVAGDGLSALWRAFPEARAWVPRPGHAVRLGEARITALGRRRPVALAFETRTARLIVAKSLPFYIQRILADMPRKTTAVDAWWKNGLRWDGRFVRAHAGAAAVQPGGRSNAARTPWGAEPMIIQKEGWWVWKPG